MEAAYPAADEVCSQPLKGWMLRQVLYRSPGNSRVTCPAWGLLLSWTSGAALSG